MRASFGSQLGGSMGNNTDAGKGFGGMLRGLGSRVGALFGGGSVDAGQQLRIEVFFGLLGYLAKSDGIVTSHESDYVNELMNTFKLPLKGREIAHHAFERGRHGQLDVQAEVQRFLAAHPHGSAECQELYTTLLQLAASDGRFYPREQTALESLVVALGYSAADMRAHMESLIGSGD